MSVKRKYFGNGMIIDIPNTFVNHPRLKKEIENKLGSASKRWANREIKNQAKDLHGMLVREMLDTSKHPYLTGNMASHWEIGYTSSYAKYGAQISILQTAVNRYGKPYAHYEEALHHPLENVLRNEFLPTVVSRLRFRFRQAVQSGEF